MARVLRGPFFPEGLPLKEQLPYYNSQFATTELNGVFYRTPTPKAVVSWRDQTGRDFINELLDDWMVSGPVAEPTSSD